MGDYIQKTLFDQLDLTNQIDDCHGELLRTMAATVCPKMITRNRIHEPFEMDGRLYVATGSMSSAEMGYIQIDLREVVPVDDWEGETYAYTKKPREKSGRLGYVGIKVKFREKEFVLSANKIDVHCRPKDYWGYGGR